MFWPLIYEDIEPCRIIMLDFGVWIIVWCFWICAFDECDLFDFKFISRCDFCLSSPLLPALPLFNFSVAFLVCDVCHAFIAYPLEPPGMLGFWLLNLDRDAIPDADAEPPSLGGPLIFSGFYPDLCTLFPELFLSKLCWTFAFKN